MYLAARFLPPLAETREGAIATWVVRVLFGGAVAWAALQIYFMIHAYATYGHREQPFPLAGSDKTEILTSTVESILLLGGLLVGAASVVYLLGPTEIPTIGPSGGGHTGAEGS